MIFIISRVEWAKLVTQKKRRQWQRAAMAGVAVPVTLTIVEVTVAVARELELLVRSGATAVLAVAVASMIRGNRNVPEEWPGQKKEQ